MWVVRDCAHTSWNYNDDSCHLDSGHCDFSGEANATATGS